MSKKDFELIARVLKRCRADSEYHTALSGPQRRAAVASIDNASIDFADELAATNPRFDRERFLRACGVED